MLKASVTITDWLPMERTQPKPTQGDKVQSTGASSFANGSSLM